MSPKQERFSNICCCCTIIFSHNTTKLAGNFILSELFLCVVCAGWGGGPIWRNVFVSIWTEWHWDRPHSQSNWGIFILMTLYIHDFHVKSYVYIYNILHFLNVYVYVNITHWMFSVPKFQPQIVRKKYFTQYISFDSPLCPKSNLLFYIEM